MLISTSSQSCIRWKRGTYYKKKLKSLVLLLKMLGCKRARVAQANWRGTVANPGGGIVAVTSGGSSQNSGPQQQNGSNSDEGLSTHHLLFGLAYVVQPTEQSANPWKQKAAMSSRMGCLTQHPPLLQAVEPLDSSLVWESIPNWMD